MPFSGGVLLGVVLFWILPEIAAHYGWIGGSAGVIAGFALLWLFDRYVHPVCPSCAHTHDHGACEARLHGFAGPLLTAAAVHNFFDGWSLTTAQEQSSESLKMAFLLGIGIHKAPEGLALGVLLLAATGSAWKAGLGSAAVQVMMLVGGVLAMYFAQHFGPGWMSAFLSVSAGVFVFLGYHAIGSESRQQGLSTAVMPALTGAAGAAVLRLVPGL